VALEYAVITNTNTGDRVSAQFNPSKYSVERQNTWAQAAIPGLSAPLLQFAHGNMQTLDMELLLDTYEAHPNAGQRNGAGSDVRALVRTFTDLMDIDPETHAPPVLLFTWASLSFTCVLARVSQEFTMFASDGVPVRATLQVSFHEYRNADFESREVKRETADFTKTYVVRQGETLSAIAERTYRDPTKWRPIAIRNGIGDPLTLAVGDRLQIPRLPFLNPETGEVMR
jgi:nucleoid-associated protein YgaU